MTNISNFVYSVLVSDKPVRVFAHQNKSYILATEGVEYTLKIRNDSSNRVLANVVIDSLNILDGKVNSDGGYIINGRSSTELKGWRVDDKTVNAFKFGRKEKSYAAKSEETNGETQNCGIISFRIFAEKLKPIPEIIEKHIHHYEHYPVYPPYKDSPWTPPYNPWPIWCSTTTTTFGDNWAGQTDNYCSASILRGAGNQIKAQNFNVGMHDETNEISETPFSMGTEFSDKKVESKIVYKDFEVGNLLETFEIYYTDRKGLLNLGVPLDKKTEVVFPQAFPKFCKPPKS